MKQLALLSWFVCSLASAESYLPTRAWHLQDMSLEYYTYPQGMRDPYFIAEDETSKSGRFIQFERGSAVNFDLELLKYGYWDNRVHMDMDDRQVRHTGWQWELGLRVGPVDLFHAHHSRHGLEYRNPRGDRFPVSDQYGIRFTFVRDGEFVGGK